MKDNDLGNSLTYRYLVLADVVLVRDANSEETRSWFKVRSRSRETWTPNLRALSRLWRFAEAQSARMELIFTDEEDPEMLWRMLDQGGANPFSDHVVMHERSRILEMLPYRPDVMGVIDTPENALRYGGKGLTLEALR